MEGIYTKRTILKDIKIFINQNIYLNSLDDCFAGFLLVENHIYNVEIMFCYYDNNIYKVFDMDWNRNPILVDIYLTLSINGLKFQRFLMDTSIYNYEKSECFNVLKEIREFVVLKNE